MAGGYNTGGVNDKPKNTNPPSGGGGGGGISRGSSGSSSVSTSTAPNYAQQLIDYTKKQNEESRKSALDALAEALAQQTNIYNNQLNALESEYGGAKDSALTALEQQFDTQNSLYDNQLEGLDDQYQALRNQSEVERYKTRNALREALANRGQLDSGFGRQETLEMDTKYGNAINSINQQEQNARQDIENLRAALQKETESKRNDINNQYQSQLNEAKMQIQNLIAQLQAENAAKRAQVNQQYDSALQQAIAQISGTF